MRGDSNPLAVRLVACAPDETAYELPETASRRPQGVLTATLTRLLREPGSERLTWRQLIELLRPAVMDLVPTQRPEVAGPVDRYLFQAAERSASGVLAVRIRDGVAFLEHAALFAIGAGDRFALTAPARRSRRRPSTW
ncbi:hypothetical protein OHA72_35725 [Dactylosporangium sp. NBC_01737]|uniref:hypothetical protein n=1 Tax=Dactylosporangium sp. NBC_01737 TaxID=2975959 RepID=UPI002E128064|nr:hypothetical protein OHA72_35725 [Dactylosporangium sp. NBC_01737]